MNKLPKIAQIHNLFYSRLSSCIFDAIHYQKYGWIVRVYPEKNRPQIKWRLNIVLLGAEK